MPPVLYSARSGRRKIKIWIVWLDGLDGFVLFVAIFSECCMKSSLDKGSSKKNADVEPVIFPSIFVLDMSIVAKTDANSEINFCG